MQVWSDSRWIWAGRFLASGPRVAPCLREPSPSPSGHAGPYTAPTRFGRGSSPSFRNELGFLHALCGRFTLTAFAPAGCLEACPLRDTDSHSGLRHHLHQEAVSWPQGLSPAHFLYRILEKYLCMCLSPFLAPFTFTRVFIYQVPFWAPGDRQPGFLTFENSRSGLLLLNLYPLRTHETEHGPMLLSAVPPLWWKGLGCLFNPAQPMRTREALSSDSGVVFSLQVQARPLQAQEHSRSRSHNNDSVDTF